MTSELHSRCEHDLSFPFHERQSAPERLADIARYAAENGLDRDLFLAGKVTKGLERKIAALFGKEDAIWCPTGTMAQAIAMQIYAGRSGNRIVAMHPTSHILMHENDGYSKVHRLNATTMGNWSMIVRSSDLEAGSSCAVIELPQRHNGGALPSWKALRALKVRAAALSLPLHLDGARIWSCRPHFENREYAEIVSGFESIYASLYKDIGAIGGAVLAGAGEFVSQAKIWRTRMGGLQSEPWPAVVDALRLVDKRLSRIESYVERAKILSALVPSDKRASVSPKPPQTNMFHIVLNTTRLDAEQARDHAAEKTGVWLGSRFWGFETNERCSLEITVGEKAMNLADDRWQEAVSSMISKL